MNKIHRTLWNVARQTWIVTAEISRGRSKSTTARKRLAGATAASLLSLSPLHALAAAPAPDALPSNGRVVAGQAGITQSGNQMTINQATNLAIINWDSFNIGANAAVTFVQPGASSVALNRVLGSDPSAIYGRLSSNGQVFLINPNGVLFGKGARVDVGGLVASTLNIRDEDFLAGNYRFTRDGSTGAVINQGELNGKYVALLAPEVRNEGVIVARQGTVALAAGEAVTLSLTGNALIDIQVDKASIDTLVENRQLVQADAGTVILSAQSANQLLGRVVNSGTVDANGISADGGIIRLRASAAIANSGALSADAAANGNGGHISVIADLNNPNSLSTVDGRLSARGGSQSGDGGFIETSGSQLKFADTARIDTSAKHGRNGQWLLDPVDFTIAASGGDITGALLSLGLGLNSITIQTATGANSLSHLYGASGSNGDIFVNDSVSWNAATTLTLSAARNIEINAPITVSHANGGLALEFGQSDIVANFPLGNYLVSAPVNLATSTTGFSTKFGSDGATTNYAVITTSAGVAAINSNMSAAYVLGSDVALTSVPWAPLGNAGGDVNTLTPFNGILDGLGHKITNLEITNSANQTGVGLFGGIGIPGLVQNLGVVTSSNGVDGLSAVGILAGVNQGTIYNVYTQGKVFGSDTATNSNPVGAIGGLVGSNQGWINNSYSSAAVSAISGVQFTGGGADGGIGGLVGVNQSAITNAYASGAVTGAKDVGGLVGYTSGPITSSYAIGPVTGHADGAGNGPSNVGGLLGALPPSGIPMPLLFSTYWNTETSGQGASATDASNTSTGLTTVQAKVAANWAGFDFTNSWIMYDTVSYPLLRSMLTPFIVTAQNQSKSADGQTFTAGGGTFTAVYSMPTPGAVSTAGLTFGGAAAAATAVGGPYAITPSGVDLANNAARQDQHGYYIRFVDGSLSIAAAATGAGAGSVVDITAVIATLLGSTTTNTLGTCKAGS